MCDYNELETKCYKAYQLDWMLSHGYDLDDFLHGLLEADENLSENYPIGDRKTIMDAVYTEFKTNLGFDQELWACKAEFLETEFKDVDYMKHLFDVMPYQNRKNLWISYKNYMFDNYNQNIED